MKNIREFINTVRTVNITTEKVYPIVNVGYVQESDMPENGRQNFKSKMIYTINKINEIELKRLHNNARVDLITLSKEGLQNTLTSLQSFDYKYFSKECSKFYVRFSKGAAHPMHEEDFKRSMQNAFICNMPEKGNITMGFLNDLIEDVGTKKGHVYAMIEYIKTLITPEPVDNSGNDFKGLSNFLELKGLAKITPELLQTIHEHKQLPLGTERIKWIKLANAAESFRLKMWPHEDRRIFNKCFDYGKAGTLKAVTGQEPSIYGKKIKSFFKE